MAIPLIAGIAVAIAVACMIHGASRLSERRIARRRAQRT
jgi:hypothetical protein